MQSAAEQSAIANCSDEQLEVPVIFEVPINTFEQLPIFIGEDVTRSYTPIAIIYQSINSVVVKSKISKPLNGCSGQNETETIVAIKFTPMAQVEGEILHKLHKVQCPNIVKCHQLFTDSIVLEFYTGTLNQLILRHQNIGSNMIRKLLEECTTALLRLDQLGIIHSDLHPNNILYRQTGEEIEKFVLADFAGSSIGQKIENLRESQIIQVKQLGSFCQTWQYRAPEIFLRQYEISSKVDMWGVGCILFECMTGESLLPAQTNPESYLKYLSKFATEQKIMKRLRRFSFPSQIELFEKILLSLLKFNPAHRLRLVQLEGLVFPERSNGPV